MNAEFYETEQIEDALMDLLSIIFISLLGSKTKRMTSLPPGSVTADRATAF